MNSPKQIQGCTHGFSGLTGAAGFAVLSDVVSLLFAGCGRQTAVRQPGRGFLFRADSGQEAKVKGKAAKRGLTRGVLQAAEAAEAAQAGPSDLEAGVRALDVGARALSERTPRALGGTQAVH